VTRWCSTSGHANPPDEARAKATAARQPSRLEVFAPYGQIVPSGECVPEGNKSVSRNLRTSAKHGSSVTKFTRTNAYLRQHLSNSRLGRSWPAGGAGCPRVHGDASVGGGRSARAASLGGGRSARVTFRRAAGARRGSLPGMAASWGLVWDWGRTGSGLVVDGGRVGITGC
jgi:hypothetical protein